MSIKRTIKRGLRYIIKGVPDISIKAKVSLLKPSKKLEGKKIFLTGGSRGIGYAMAKKFVSEGAEVVITGRNVKTLKASAEKLSCKYLVLDVTKTEDFENAIGIADNMLGGLNCLVNNAGVSLHEPTFFDVTPHTFDQQINTNLRSDVFLIQCFIKHLLSKSSGGGSILCVSSEVGELADNRPYGWTKSAINSVVRGLASNFAKDGIRINAISPGITCSDMTGVNEDNLYIPTNSTQRAYLPNEVAEVAAFLLSDAAGCLSGQILVCNNAKTIYTRQKVEKNG
jgi:NAD(P)-dependent dehydrogenase (short-subunit alcohol dehydrogenase family)